MDAWRVEVSTFFVILASRFVFGATANQIHRNHEAPRPINCNANTFLLAIHGFNLTGLLIYY